jgi:hypothetical protein
LIIYVGAERYFNVKEVGPLIAPSFVERTEYPIKCFGDDQFDIRRGGKGPFSDDRVMDNEQKKSGTWDPAKKIIQVLKVESLNVCTHVFFIVSSPNRPRTSCAIG